MGVIIIALELTDRIKWVHVYKVCGPTPSTTQVIAFMQHSEALSLFDEQWEIQVDVSGVKEKSVPEGET